MMSFQVFLKWIRKVTSPDKIKQKNSAEFLGYAFHNIYNKNDPPDPADPKPSILPGCSRTTHSGYGTTPVWCRGGNRYVEGCWGVPYLKITMICLHLLFSFFSFYFHCFYLLLCLFKNHFVGTSCVKKQKFGTRICKHNIFQTCAHLFLICSEVSL